MAATKWTPQVIAAEVARKQAANIPLNNGKPVPQLAVKPQNPIVIQKSAGVSPQVAKPTTLPLRPGMDTTPKPLPMTPGTPVQGWGGVGNKPTVPAAKPVSPAPTYNEQAQTNYGTGPLANILYSKKQYDSGAASGSAGLKGWAANNANQYYGQLDPAEAAKVKGMSTQQLIDYINTQNTAPAAAEVAPESSPEVSPQQYVPPNYADYVQNPTSPNAGPPGSSPFDPAAFEKSAIENQIRAYQERQKAALDAANFGVNTNKAYLDEQVGKMKTAKNQNDLTIQETENRFGGVYSGGMRLGQAANLTSTNEAIGGATRDVAARNQQLLDQYGNQANSIADQIKQIQTATPDIIRQKINDWMTKQADMTGYYNGQRTMPGQQFDRGMFESDRNFGRGVYEDDRNFGYQAGQDQIQNDAQYGGSYKGGQTVDQAQRDWQNRFDYGNAIGQFGNGQKTMEQQKFLYQQTRDKIADEGAKRDFDENVRQFGLNYALNQLKGGSKDNPPGAMDSATRMYFDGMVQRDPDSGEITNKTAIENAILNSELSDYDAYQLYLHYELPWNGPVPARPNQ